MRSRTVSLPASCWRSTRSGRPSRGRCAGARAVRRVRAPSPPGFDPWFGALLWTYDGIWPSPSGPVKRWGSARNRPGAEPRLQSIQAPPLTSKISPVVTMPVRPPDRRPRPPLLRPAQTPDRQQRLKCVGKIGGHRRGDRAGCDTIHRDVLAGKFLRQIQRDRMHAGFRGAIGDVARARLLRAIDPGLGCRRSWPAPIRS